MRKVNIVGTGFGWKDAPYDDGKVWSITSLVLSRPEVDLVIDMNVYDDLRWGEIEKEHNDRVLDLCANKNIPYIGLKNYPLDRVRKSFPDIDYFTSTVSYALALAVHKNFDEIHTYGINMTFGEEYAYQKPCADFWCGVAMGRRIKIVAHGEGCSLMRAHDGMMYGYDIPQKNQVFAGGVNLIPITKENPLGERK